MSREIESLNMLWRSPSEPGTSDPRYMITRDDVVAIEEHRPAGPGDAWSWVVTWPDGTASRYFRAAPDGVSGVVSVNYRAPKREQAGCQVVNGIQWIACSERMPRIGDPEIDPGVDGTTVLFIWEGSVYCGWPRRGDATGEWEASEFTPPLSGVKWWARWSAPEEGGS